ncbi:MAG TPA: CinA family nicotinamide mononucleotide deamidase-related protein [Pirellulales bacterium]|jgi:nicotinamide-nucleotide amidase|nr:CinA family nicotinamide mononucleotide deamidase-related protein [Pirellulales bacterium]
MLAEIISIGDELASGQRLDTNSQWLSQQLGDLGVTVRYHTTVADDLEANVEVFREAARRADIVVATGGLGPTADDLTREALAKMLGVELKLDQPSLDYIRALFARRRREMPERNVVQAMFPDGSRVIANPHGTAPGIDLTVPPPVGRPSRLFALPGVPAEMKEMWHASVVGRLIEQGAGQQVIHHRRVKCFGVGESALEQMLPDLIRRGRVPSVGITVSEATITLRITASGRTPEECLAAMAPTEAVIHECLGSLVFGYEEDELADVVVRRLSERGATLATIEWGTGGLMAHWLGNVPGSAGVFRGGLVAGGPAGFGNLLEVRNQQTREECGEMAATLATACRERFGADFGLVVGTSLESESESESDPQARALPPVFLALSSCDGVTVRTAPFAAHPAIMRPLAAKQALNLLRLRLIHQGSGEQETRKQGR